ncbi:hypothetical protein Osc7112_2422 [Oscillatoria nigro-viridis PCC 7112]|uniref:Uncharacterized protein n=1 Tax=Phormidium nigroviride PCC 7112 TaxID=179408 RepID=K9VHY7_9CYAN|nr:hypothetical protein Osc7112_2422 [Oscillatoria nigro-viridis PCC 7112]
MSCIYHHNRQSLDTFAGGLLRASQFCKKHFFYSSERPRTAKVAERSERGGSHYKTKTEMLPIAHICQPILTTHRNLLS